MPEGNHVAEATHEHAVSEQVFLGSWLVQISVGQAPSVLRRDSINPLAADALVSFLADGTLIASGSPVYPVPAGAIQADRLLAGTGHGSWVAQGEGAVAVRCAVLLYLESGSSEATLFVDATVQLDPDNDTFSGPYTIDTHLSRHWVRNLPPLDGSVQGWRVEAPTGTGTPAD
jgi:hypothetical protein